MKPILLAMLFALPACAQQTSAELDAVLQRATDYVTRYEAELGNLIGSEDYVQNAVWFHPRRAGGYPQVARKMQRRIVSDFLIIQTGPEWTALRKVNYVDGMKLHESQPAFEEAFENSPEGNAKLLRALTAESTQYNIGDIKRDINLPTFALKVLRKNEVARFSFARAGAGKVSGIQTWVVRFHERTGLSLVLGGKGEMLHSNGRLWIEPDTGRILQTEFILENPHARSPIKARIDVTYGNGKNVKMLVPTLMIEHYETDQHSLDGRASYSNFRSFQVDVQFEINYPKP